MFASLFQQEGVHLHLVLRQRTSFVGTNHGDCSHRFTGMKLAHKIVRLEHSSHIESQGECDGHRQTFWHSHHYQCDGHHEILQHKVGHIKIILASPYRIGQDVVTEKQYKSGYRNY